MRYRRALTMTVLLTSATSSHTRNAQAQEAPATDVVVVGTRSSESIQRATIRTGVVTREEAERRGARNVAEALAGETSLQVNPEAYGYLGRPSGVQMQGLDAERVLILEDGERVTGDVGGVIDLAKLPLADVARIEYVTGPTSSLYGTNALGGVVNIVTAPPRRQGGSARARLEARARGDSLGEASAAYRRDDAWATADFSLNHAPSAPLRPGQPDTLVPSVDSRLLGLRLGTTLPHRIQLRLKLRWVHDDLSGRSSETVPGLGVYLVNLPEVTDRITARAQETIQLTPAARLDFSLARSWFSGESKRDRQNSPIDELHQRKLETQSFESVLTLQDGQARTWILGARSETEQFAQELQATELLEGQLRTRRTPEVARTQLANGALFGQLAWLLRQDFTLLPGMRAELHDRYGSVLAPRLALAFRPTSQLSLRTAIGRGFRAPTAKEYGFIFDHSAIGYRVLGNPDLKPERSWGVTGDISWQPQSWLLLRASGFGNWVSELIGTDLALEQASAGITDYTYVNVSRARTAGGDALVRVTPNARLSFDAGYAHLWTRDDSTGEPLPTRPPHTVTLAVTGKPLERLEGSVRYRWVSPAFVTDEVRAPGFGGLDARLGCRVWRDIQAYAGVLNLLDEKKDPNRLGDARPALGRSFYVGVRGALPGSKESDASH
jgi:outer membrane receptor for ferrienterochelin and colicins